METASTLRYILNANLPRAKGGANAARTQINAFQDTSKAMCGVSGRYE